MVAINRSAHTFIAALLHDRVTAPFVLEGAMNGETFVTGMSPPPGHRANELRYSLA